MRFVTKQKQNRMAVEFQQTRIRYVVDASAAVKLYLSDEDEREAAAILFNDFLEDRIELAAPVSRFDMKFQVQSAKRFALIG